ncbi:MAG: phosphonate ABC transporter, permease protein PhnE [Spirochaetota bacterium]
MVAVLLSGALPGLGQVVLGQLQRGLLMIAGFLSAAGIFVWRIADLGRRVEGFWPTVERAFQRNGGFFGAVAAGFVILWILTMIDAYRGSRDDRRGRPFPFLVLILVYFLLGWQVSDIDVGRAVAEFPEAIPPLSRVLWPWEAAVEYEEERITAESRVLIGDPEEHEPPPAPEETPGEPYVRTDPTYGELATQDLENLRQIPGSELEVVGRGFEPNTRLQLWWIDEINNSFRLRKEGEFISVMTDDQGGFETTVTMPYPILQPDRRQGPVYHRIEARQTFQGEARASEALRITISRMVETIIMGMMATLFGIVFSIPVSFLAARNIMSASWLTMAIYYLTRTILNIIRSIEPLIWALIAVVWVGLGPFAGIVALTVHSIAALGKLYSEAIEGIDHGPIEAIQATGANPLQTIAFGVIPQMISPFISFSIYRWDINVRMSTVIGLVGGGGVGFILVQYIRLLDYRAAGIAVWFIAITVALLDYVSAEIRDRLM